MSRVSEDQIINGVLVNGYDYENQAWVKDGKYIRCGHPETMDCRCFGKIHEGMTVEELLFLEQMDTENENKRDFIANGGHPDFTGF